LCIFYTVLSNEGDVGISPFQKNIAYFLIFIFPNEISQFKKKRKENNANTLHKVGNNAFGAVMSIF
jgi:hypothetical protein